MPHSVARDRELTKKAQDIFVDTWLYLQGLMELNPTFTQQGKMEQHGINRNVLALNKSALFPDKDPEKVVSEHEYSMLLRQLKLYRLFSDRTKEACKHIEMLSKYDPPIDTDECKNQLINLYHASLRDKKFKIFADYTTQLKIVFAKMKNKSQDLIPALQTLKILSVIRKPTYEEDKIDAECSKLQSSIKSYVSILATIEQDNTKKAVYRKQLLIISRENSEAITFEQKIQFIKTLTWFNFKLQNEIFTIHQNQTATTCKKLPLLYQTDNNLREAQNKLIECYKAGAHAVVKHAQQIQKLHEENSLPAIQEESSAKRQKI